MKKKTIVLPIVYNIFFRGGQGSLGTFKLEKAITPLCVTASIQALRILSNYRLVSQFVKEAF